MVNSIPSHILEKYPDYVDLLLNCTIACRIVYDSNPIELLKSSPFVSYRHSLSNLCYSQQVTSPLIRHINPLNDIKYLISDIGQKRILAAFRGSICTNDFITDARINFSSNAYIGKIHSGFFDRSESVPINYFIKKLSQGYKLVLTGHSLGAAISCLIAVKLILNTKIGQQNSDKILFIGFGCPLIGDELFKNNIEKMHKEKFHFIKNEDDLVVIALDYLTNQVHSDLETTNLSDDKSFMAKIQKGIQIAKPLMRTLIPKYQQFGIQFQLDKNGLQMVHTVKMDSLSQLGNLNTLLGQAYNHFIQNYFYNFDSNYFSHLKCDNIKLFEIINDLNLSENNSYSLKIVRKMDVYEILITFNSIENRENILCAKLVSGENVTFNFNDPLKDNLCFKFELKILKIGTLNGPLELTLIGHFNSVKYDITFDPSSIEESFDLSRNNINKFEMASKAISLGFKFFSKK